MKNTIPGLDGFRAVAFLLVFLFHEGLLGFGWAGVQMFFVLSGFLITRILIRPRRGSLGFYLKSFYGRRALRIFPLYYGYLLSLGIAGLLLAPLGLRVAADAVHQLAYAATYSYNFFHASSSFTHNLTLAHFWSLAVEEQFYLLWPIIIFFTPRKTLPRLLAVMVIGGPLLRVLTGLTLSRDMVPFASANVSMAIYVLPWCQFDAFAIGGLLNFVQIPHHRRLSFLSLVGLPVLGLITTWMATGRIELLGTMGYPLFLNNALKQIWGYSLIAAVSAIVLYSISKRSFFPRLFENPSLAYLGKISYGLYVFHFPMILLTGFAIHRFEVTLSPIIRVALDLLLTTIVAAGSYRFFEQRFLAMKDRIFSNELAERCFSNVDSVGVARAPN